MKSIRSYRDPYPYVRRIIAELGFDIATAEFVQLKRKHGRSKASFYHLFDLAMAGFVHYSRVPLRLATLTGFAVALTSLLVAVFYFVYKLLYWDSFTIGVASLIFRPVFLFDRSTDFSRHPRRVRWCHSDAGKKSASRHRKRADQLR